MKPNRCVQPIVPTDWSPQQALAVFELLHALREQLLNLHGSAIQQAWRDQLAPHPKPADFDPHDPF